MNIKKFFVSLFAAIVVTSVCVFVSCEVGLGPAVDVQPPSVTIETPEVDKIIRDKFSISGVWTDDVTADSIEVILKRTDKKTLDGTNYERKINATVNFSPDVKGTGSWYAIVDPLEPENHIIDGTYIATVTIKDKGSHSTTQTTTFTIDNTPPVIVLTRPSTSDNSASFDTYGQNFTLEGQAADTNNVSLIMVKIYNDPECTPESFVHEVPLKNVPNSINMDVAKFKKGDITTDYYKIYGHADTDAGELPFYCKVVAYDGAERFPIDADQTEEDKLGNAVDYYYLYKDIATEVLQEYKITEVYSIYDGTYTDSSSSARTVTTNDVLELLETKKTLKGKFKLNPKNNPTFTVTGKSPVILGPGAFEGTTYNITNGSQVVFEVSPGLDGILLNEETLHVYAQKCDDEGTIDTTAPLIDITTTPQESGTSYKFITSVSSDKGFVIGNNYIIWVDGEDYAAVPNKVEASGGVTYGFHMSASGMAPVLDVTTPARTPEYSNNPKQTFKGTINVEEGLPTLKITADGVPYEIKTFDKKEVLANELRYTFEWEAPEFTDAQGKGTHDFTFQAVLEGKSQLIERTIVYDTEKPIIEDIKISEAKKYDSTKEDGTVLEGRYLNGIVKGASVGISDDYDSIKTASYKIIINDDEAAAQEVTIPNPAKFQFPDIDTTNYADNSKLTIKITATDRAGNTQTHSEDFIVDQSTDVPVVWPRNSEEISLKNTTVSYYKTGTESKKGVITAGSNLELKLYDDDGTDKNKLQISITASTKLNSDSDIQSSSYNAVSDYTIIDDVLSFKIPDDGGFYCYKITVTDIANSKSNVLTPFVINAARSAATITNITKTPSYIRNAANEKFEVKIEGVSSLGPYQLYRKIGESNDFKWIKEADDFPITDTITLTAANAIAEGSKAYYYVQDSTPRDSNKEKYIDLHFDDEAPTVTINSPGSSKQGINALSELVPFSGRASDAKSGVEKIFYKFSKTKITTPSTDGTADGYTEVPTVNGPWELEDITFKEGTEHEAGKLEEGKWFFYVYAQDAAGNPGTVQEREFDINLKSPELSVTIPTGANCSYANGAYYFKSDLSGTVTASDTDGAVSLNFQIDGDTPQTLTVNQSKEFTLDGSLFTESKQQKLTIIATDQFGKTKSESFNVYKDSASPVLSVTNPGNQDSNSVTIMGSVNDLGVGVNSVKWSTAADGTYAAVSNFTNGNPNWTHTISNLGAQGSKTYYFKAEDVIGNTKTESVTFTYDAAKPEIRIGGTFATEKDYFATQGFTLSGKAWDTYSLDHVSILKNNEEVGSSALGTQNISTAISEDSAATWSKSFTLGTEDGKLPDGEYTFKISAYDSVGKQSTVITRNITVDTTKPAVTLSGLPSKQDTKNKNYTFTGTASDTTSGVKEVKLTIKDTAGHSKTVTVDGDKRWSYTLDCSADEWATIFAAQGPKTVYVSATDEAGLTSDFFTYAKDPSTLTDEQKKHKEDSNQLTFVYDYEDPSLSIDAASMRSFMPTAGLTITGKAQDSYKLKELKITQNGGNTKTITFDQGSDQKTWSVPIPFDASGNKTNPVDKQKYSYTFELYDDVGNKVTQISQEAEADFTAPTLTITAPVGKTGENAVDETNYQLKGGFTEDNINGIYYQILSSSASEPDVPAESDRLDDSKWTAKAWTKISQGTATWSFYQKFKAKNADASVEGLPEGSYKVYLFAVDGAGNISTAVANQVKPYTATFDVDMAAPQVTVNSSVLDTYYTSSQGFANNKGSFVFSGTATDSNEITSVVISGGTKTYPLTPDNNGNYSVTFKYGSGNASDADYLADGTYVFTVAATDIAGKTSQTTKTITVDTAAPTLSNIKVNGTASDPDKWYNTTDIKLEGQVADNTGGSGVSEVVYQTSANGTTWSAEEPFIGTSTWKGTISEVVSNTTRIKITARDNAGNSSSTEVGPWQIDVNPPSLTSVKEGDTRLSESTAYYSNGDNDITLTITAADGANESGIDRVYVRPYTKLTADTVSGDTYKANGTGPFTFTISKTAITKSGTVYARIYDKAGNYTDENLFAITFDNTKPVLQSVNLEQTANSKTTDAYKKNSTTYYVNPDGKTFTLSGIATDNLAVGSVNVTMKVGSTEKYNETFSSGEYSFNNIDMSDWGNDKTQVDVTITVTDKAGNTQDTAKSVATEFSIIFDKKLPTSLHKIDSTHKDIVFRVSDFDNNDITSTTATEYNLTWDSATVGGTTYSDVDTKSGGKYGAGTFGNSVTQKVRGVFEDDGSGIKRIYYAVFDRSAENKSSYILDGETERYNLSDTDLKALAAQVINKNHYFEPGDIEYKRVFYNVNKAEYDAATTDAARKLLTLGGTLLKKNTQAVTEDKNGVTYYKYWQIVPTTYSFTIPKLVEGSNYLVLVAEDNAGNYYLDNVPVQFDPDGDGPEGMIDAVFSNFSLNLDTTAPTVESSYDDILYSNGSGSFEISVTADDPEVAGIANSSSGVKSVVFSRDGIATTVKATASGSTYSANIQPLLPANGSVSIYATVTDVASTSSKKVVANVIVDTTKPVLDASSINLKEDSNNAYKADSTYYINNTTGKTFKISGLATDNFGVQNVTIDITNTAANPETAIPTQTIPTTGSWEYTIIGWEAWTSGAEISINVTDKAGNTLAAPQKVTVAFDTTAPQIDTTKLVTPTATQTENTIFKFEGQAGSVKNETGSGFDKVDIAFNTSSTTQPSSAYTTASVDANGKWAASIEFENVVSGQGDKYLWVKPYDNAGNAGSWTSKKFVYDTARPVISFKDAAGVTNPTANSYNRTGFTLQVEADDSYGVQTNGVTVSYETSSGTQTAAMTPGSNKLYTKAFTVGTGGLADGTYTFIVTVTDKAEKTNSVSRTLFVDTTAPVISTDTETKPAVTTPVGYDDTTNSKKWYNTNQIGVSVTVDDAVSGMASVQISTDGSNFTNPSSLIKGSGNSTTWTGNIVCSNEGANTIYIRATDIAENVNSEEHITVYIDTTAPAAPVFLGAGSSGSITPANEITSLLVNPSLGNAVTVYGALIDDGNDANAKTGIADTGAFKQKGKSGTATKITTLSTITAFTPAWAASTEYAEGNVVKNGSALYLCKTQHKSSTTFDSTESAKWTDITNYSFWSYTIPTSDMTNGGINFTVKDKATNTADYVLFQMVVDSTAPSVEIKSFTTPGSQTNLGTEESPVLVYDVNGTITISGSASDGNKLESVKLEYQKAGTSSWTEIAQTAESTPNSWIAQLDTTGLTDNTKYTLKATATDAAGNSKTATQNIYINQDTDRPVITVTNPASLEGLPDAVIWENSTISGTVSDDDTITYFGYYKGTSVDENTEYTSIPRANGIWKIEGLKDEPATIFFKVTAAGKDYFANTSTTYNDTVKLNTYKLTDGTLNFGYRPASGTTTTATKLSLVIDTVAPDAETPEYSLDGGTTWKQGLGSVTLGGTLNRYLKIRQSAWDSNTVKSMTVKVIETIDGEDQDTLLVNQVKNTYEKEIEKPNGNKYRQFVTDTIDVNSWASTFNDGTNSNSKRLEITMSDGIKSTVTKVDLTVDNTAPVITFSAPSNDSINSGETTVYGTTDEIGKIYYTVSTDGTTKPSEGQKLTSWTGYTVADDGSTTPKNDGTIIDDEDVDEDDVYPPAYSQIPNAGVSWYVYFDGVSGDTQRAHASQLKNFATSLGLTENLATFENLVNFYVWIKIEDAVGNSEEYSHLVCVDPQGDRPTVSLSNPEEPKSTAEDGAASVGGTVKLYGSAEDSNGTVESVWVQLLSAKNGTGYGAVTQTGNVITAFSPTSKDLDFWKSKGYTVEKMKPDANGVHAAWTGTTESPGTVPSGASASDYGIKANFSGSSWNLKINQNGEFDPVQGSKTANNMAVRIYACDNDKNLSYAVTRFFKMDKDTPVISDVVLKQYASNDTTFSNPLASQEVRSGMFVKGKWYLEFKATDNESLSAIALRDSDNNDTTIPNANINKGNPESVKEWTVRYPLPTDTAGVGSFKRTIKAEDNANHTGTYDIEINYDNEPPKLLVDSADDFDIASSVKQSNGFYKLYSKVSDASTTGTPSGVKSVGFYFLRRDENNKGLIYDPLQERAEPVSTDDLVYEDGLYWLSGSISCNSNTGEITLDDGLSDKVAYIHAGSYIKLDGVMYKISSKTGTKLSIDESFDTSLTSAKIALAQFVDNRKSEYEASSEKDASGYYTSIKNDDGDSMIEELGGTTAVSSWQGSIVSRNIPDGPIEIHYTAYDESLNYAVGVVGNKDYTAYSAYPTSEVAEIKNKQPVLDGQYASYVYTYDSSNPAYISNNAPRLAGVTVAIDYTGTGNLANATRTTYYYQSDYIRIDDNGTMVKKPVGVTSNFVISGETKDDDDNITAYKGVTTIKGKTWIIPEMIGGNGKLWYTYNVYGSTDADSAIPGTKDTTNDAKASSTTDGTTTATYFADGTNEFDQYESVSYGSSYVDSHVSKKNGVEAGIEHDLTFFEGTGDATIAQPLWFDYVIYDSTEVEPAGDSTTTSLATNQKATISIAMAVEVNDNINPNVVINPFYWKSLTDNSIYGSGTATSVSDLQGHIELEEDWKTTTAYANRGTDKELDGDAKVSGKIVISGYAYDNIRLKSLKVTIPKSTVLTSETTVAMFDGGQWYDSSTAVHDGVTKGDIASNGWSFTVSTAGSDGAYADATGHKVKWSLAYDTSKVTGVAATDVVVTVTAEDAKAKSSSNRTVNAESTEDTVKHVPTYQMDVVPYIKGITTELSEGNKKRPSVLSRSALGVYPVRRNSKLTVNGFNFTGTTTGVSIGGTAYTPQTETTQNAILIDTTKPVTANATLASGEVIATVSSITSLNNKTAKSVTTGTGENAVTRVIEYNTEPNGQNNDLLTDKREVWVVDVTTTVDTKDKRKLDMVINGTTITFGAGYQDSYYSTMVASGTSLSNIQNLRNSFTRYFDSAIDANDDGTIFTVSSCGDTYMGPVTQWGNGPSHFALTRGDAGSAAIVWEYDRKSSNSSGYTPSTNTKKIYLESNWNGANLNNLERILWPNIVVTGGDSATKGCISYYDTTQKLIKFRYFTSDGSKVANNLASYKEGSSSNSIVEGSVRTDLTTKTNSYQYYDRRWRNGTEQRTFTFTQGYTAIAGADCNSAYSVTAVSGTTALVAWYDASAGALKMKYNESPATSYSGYQVFNEVPDAGTITFKISVDGGTAKDVSVTYATPSGGDEKHEFAYQLNLILSNGYGAYAEVDPAMNKVVVRSMQTGEDSSISITNLSSGTVYTGTQTFGSNPYFFGQHVGDGSKWEEVTIDNNSAGQFVAMKTDSKGGIHFAYYDTGNGDLKYAYMSSVTATPVVVTVDGYQQVGQYVDLAIKENADGSQITPYISYYSMSNADTKRSAKVAKLVSPITYNGATANASSVKDGSVDELFTGAWEVFHVPTAGIPVQYRVNIGVTTGGNVYISYLADRIIEYVKVE